MKSSNSPGFTAVARLLRPRGNRGELLAESWTSWPDRFSRLKTVTLRPSGAQAVVDAVWFHDGRPVFHFAGVDSINDAEKLAGQLVTVPLEERVQLGEGEIFYGDLIGCAVHDQPSNRALGTVDDYHEAPPGPILLSVGPHLIPFVPDLCPSVDLEARRIETHLPEGFLEVM